MRQLAGTAFAILTLVHGGSSAQAYQMGNGCACYYTDTVNPQYQIALADDDQMPLPSGDYVTSLYLDGAFFDTLKIHINSDRSLTVRAANNAVIQCPDTAGFAPGSRVLTGDGILYNGSGGTVVGSVKELELGTYSFAWYCVYNPSCQVGLNLPHSYNSLVKLTIGGKVCRGSSDSPGNLTTHLDSLNLNIGLGPNALFQSSGLIKAQIDFPATNMGTPLLLVPVAGNGFTVISNYGVLRQVLSGQVLADIVTNSPYQFNVRLFSASNKGTTNSGGIYQPTNSPFKTLTFQNPDGITNYNRLWLQTVEGNVTNLYQYIYDTNSTRYSNAWQLVYPSNLRREVLSTIWRSDWGWRTNLYSVYAPGSPDVLAYQDQKLYQDFGLGPILVQQVIDPNGARLTNTWSYYTDSLKPGSYGRLAFKSQWNGFWETHQYDASGRETNVTSSFLNATTNAPANQCRVVATSYSSSAPQVTHVEYLLGQEVSRVYIAGDYTANKIYTVKPLISGTAWNGGTLDAYNEVTIKSFNGSFQTTNLLNPDGTKVFYNFVTNADFSIITTATSGQTNSTGTGTAEGTKTISVVGPFGQMISNIVLNITGGTDGALLARDSYTYSASDYNYSSPTVTHLDGTITSGSSGSCCGTPNLGNDVDKDGTITYYTFDAMQRRTSTTLNNVTTTNIFDAAGNLLANIRTGSDSSMITNRISVYDVASRLVAETNALSGVTLYSNLLDSLGELVKTNTYPDGGTRVETYYLDGSLKTVTGTAVYPVRYEYGVLSDAGVQRAYKAEIKLDASGADTSECVTNVFDMLGRIYKTVYAGSSGGVASVSRYNSNDQLTNQVDPDGVSTLYQYNGKGELAVTAVDINGNGTIDFGGTDRITSTTNDVVVDNGTNVRRTRTFVWATNNAASSNLVSTTEISVDGLHTWNTLWNSGVAVTSQSQTFYDPVNGYRIVTNTAPDGSFTVSTNQFGRLVSVTKRDSTGTQIGQTLYGYDAHGRQNTVTDARTGTTTNFYNNADQVSSTVSPVPAAGQSAEVTVNYFDNLGRILRTTLPDNTSVTNEFYPTGLVKRNYGSRTYPVGYSYDAQGRMKTMTNWSGFASGSGARVTTWNYDGYRGFLTNKVYDGNTAGPGYAYTAAGRLKTRTWARGVTTTYGYTTAGDLQTASYSDSTPGLTNGYDRRGRQTTATNGIVVCTLAYNDAGQLLGESYSGGPLDGTAVTNAYDSFLRRASLAVSNQPSTLVQFGYDNASRLQTVAAGGNTVAYTLLANSPLVSQINFTNNGTRRMVVSKSYDNLNRLLAVSNAPAALSQPPAFNYQYNSANQRTAVTNGDNSYWVYQFDTLGQVTVGNKYWSDGTPVAGQQFDYTFDTIGNRTTTGVGGDQTGANLRYASYSANNLNQYTSRTVPGYVNVLGTASSNATVLVNSQGVYRKGNYFRAELAENNAASAVFASITNLAVLTNGTATDTIATNFGSVFVSQTPETFGYDPDGNLTNDGRWVLTWDAENRLINLTSLNSAPTGSQLKLDFGYDYRGRRIQKVVSTLVGASYVTQRTNKFVYDGWNLLAEVAANNSLIRSYVWGGWT